MANDAEWLVMLYLAGDNNLSSEMIWALKEIEDEGLPPGFEMTILYDALSPCCPTYVYDLSGATAKGPEGATVMDPKREAIAPLPLISINGTKSRLYEWVEDSSSPQVLRNFIEWSVVERPAKHRMLILSGHGSGAVGDFLTDDHAGDEQNRSLSIPSLQRALDKAQANLRPGVEGKLIDVLGMDSCLMSMAEVCYQVRESVSYLVGSEGFVQNAGWPYGRLLKQLRRRIKGRDGLTPELIAGYVVQDYIAYYREYLPANVSVDMAACEIAKLGDSDDGYQGKTVRRGVKELTDFLIPPLTRCTPEPDPPTDPPSNEDKWIRDAVTLAHWRAQSYKFEQYTDLWDFCLQLRELGKGSPIPLMREITQAAERVQNAISESVGRKNGNAGRQDYEGIDFQHSHGLSVYFPWSSAGFSDTDQDAYRRLAFAGDSGWGNFLVAYLGGTRRELRTNGGSELTMFGMGSLDAKRKAAHRNAPESGKNAPESGKNAPESGKNAPESGKMLALLLGSRLSMKNPPQSVYLRPTPEADQEYPVPDSELTSHRE
jgi:Clostripain family